MNPKNTADQAFVRETNLSLVLRLIHNQSPVSRAQLAGITGLNKSTVSSLVDELIERRLVHEIGSNTGGAGRPATLIEINPQAGIIIGVELGVDFISAAITDAMGQIVWRKMEDTRQEDGQEKMIAQTLRIVKEAMTAGKRKNHRILGLGLSTPGTVDINEGVLVFAPNLHWHNVPFAKIFSEQVKVKVFVENDANAAAIAEHLFGAARQCQDFLFVFAGVGIGGGLFLNGKLYRGRNGYAGEIGHSPIVAEPRQTICHCGNRGCWETYANQQSVIQRVQTRLAAKHASVIPQIMEEKNTSLTLSVIRQAADIGDQEAIASFMEAGQAMGQGIAGLINIFNPEQVILGGPLSVAGRYLLPAIKETVASHAMPEINRQADIKVSAFGPDSSLIGAAAIVVNDLLAHPSRVERG
ncbi:ROK family transcriptional regulator [Chloroflexi bacterium CFX5]|nr:ROK family transcriptional regulator [Chloroflexi bacterium CFX5]